MGPGDARHSRKGRSVTEPQELIDKQRVRAAFNRAADSYDGAAVLQREVAQRLLERLDYVRLEPAVVLDLGAGTGACSEALRARYKGAQVIALDLAEAMLAAIKARHGGLRRLFRGAPGLVCGDIERLPFADDSVDLIVSNLALQWCNGVEQAFAEFRRVLKPEGLLMFTTFGPDTLKELRQSWSQADGYSHVSRFMDMHDIGDGLLQAGFSNPVMDMEQLCVTYPDVFRLMHDLKAIGAQNATAGRAPGLTGKQRMQAMQQAYEGFRNTAGQLPASHEIVYGHAWKPSPGGTAGNGREQYVPVDMLHQRSK